MLLSNSQFGEQIKENFTVILKPVKIGILKIFIYFLIYLFFVRIW